MSATAPTSRSALSATWHSTSTTTPTHTPTSQTSTKRRTGVSPREVDLERTYVSRGFRGRRAADVDPARVPPGQYVTRDFPVLSAGPTPHTALELWDFSIVGELAEPRGWTWEEVRALPSEEITRDIHCVTKWSKLDTVWRGVSVDTLLEGIETSAEYVTAYSADGYTTNLSLEDVTGGKAWVVFAYEGQPLAPEHGGPARMLVPQHYFWKSVWEPSEGGPLMLVAGGSGIVPLMAMI